MSVIYIHVYSLKRFFGRLLLRNVLCKMNKDFEIQNVSFVRKKHSKEISEKVYSKFQKISTAFFSRKKPYFLKDLKDVFRNR